MRCFFVSDLHGKKELYDKLQSEIASGKPDVVFIGGDITPNIVSGDFGDFFLDYLGGLFNKLKDLLNDIYPEVFIILGNDDSALVESKLNVLEEAGLLKYINCKKRNFKEYEIYGYNYVPPTPFLLKDWEKYDVSRYLDPGDVSPEEGFRTIMIEAGKIKYSTIAEDLDELTGERDVNKAIFLFHSPPYNTNLDRIANDGKMIDYVPLPINVGSIAIRRFIEKRQPLLTLHGHIHESARLTGSWKDKIGNTYCFNAAHDGKGLSLIKFDTSDLKNAERVIV